MITNWTDTSTYDLNNQDYLDKVQLCTTTTRPLQLLDEILFLHSNEVTVIPHDPWETILNMTQFQYKVVSKNGDQIYCDFSSLFFAIDGTVVSDNNLLLALLPQSSFPLVNELQSHLYPPSSQQPLRVRINCQEPSVKEVLSTCSHSTFKRHWVDIDFPCTAQRIKWVCHHHPLDFIMPRVSQTASRRHCMIMSYHLFAGVLELMIPIRMIHVRRKLNGRK